MLKLLEMSHTVDMTAVAEMPVYYHKVATPQPSQPKEIPLKDAFCVPMGTIEGNIWVPRKQRTIFSPLPYNVPRPGTSGPTYVFTQ